VVPKQKKQNGFAEHFQSFCKDKLPFQLLPREIVTLESLPKNNAGKILKQVLRNA
jgi:acyl-CoA synthetase (AMP-forming)/AMP-acid ligase II